MCGCVCVCVCVGVRVGVGVWEIGGVCGGFGLSVVVVCGGVGPSLQPYLFMFWLKVFVPSCLSVCRPRLSPPAAHRVVVIV